MKRSHILTGLAVASAALASLIAAPAASAQAIAIATVKHDGPVDFEKEILPIFRRNCLACHSTTDAESDLVLENPQTILKGGSDGPSVVPGKGAESLLLKLAAKQKEPFMPPPDNDVKAKALTPDELGLIKLWIDQGAKGEVKAAGGAIAWQPLPAGVNPIYAVAVTADGQYAAASRANQIFLYHIPSKRELGRLTDPELLKKGVYTQPGVADLDMIQALKFSPDGSLLASGGYRTLKLWRRPTPGKTLDLSGLESPARSIAVSADGKSIALGEESGKIKIFETATGKIAKKLEGHTGPVSGLAFSADGAKLVSGSQDKTFRVWNVAEQKQLASIETPAAVNAVAIVTEGKQVATGGADNKILLWALPDAQPAEAAKPVKEITGHTGPITSLAAVGPTGAQLLSGSADKSSKLWDLDKGTAAKTLNHALTVSAVAARADGKRFVTAGENSAKLWNGENSQVVADLKGDFRTSLNVAAVTRAQGLAKRHVDLAKADLEDAKKRKTAEEDNQKKSKEAITKAEMEFKTKDEAVKTPTKDKEAADKALADATAAKTKADDAKKLTDEAAPKAADALKLATTDRDAAVKSAADAEKALKAAQDAVAKAKEAAVKDAASEDLKKALAAAEKAAADADAVNKKAVDAKTAADKKFAEAEAAKKAADTAKAEADKAATAAQTAFTQADAKVKQVLPVFTKATDERSAADRALQAAKRAVERADEAVKKAGESLPGFESTVKQMEDALKALDAGLAAATKLVTESEKPFKACAFSPDGKTLAVVGDDQLLHTYDSETGAPIDALSGLPAASALVAFANDGRAIVAADKAAAAWDFATEWKLERTIGSPDSAEMLIDRVTAIDFAPDGKSVATGGGEPSRSGEIKIWEIASGKLIKAFKDPHSDTVFALDFSPDGKQIASCGADRFVKVFETADGKFVRSFEGHTHHVLGVTWKTDGRVLVSSGADNVLKVWDARTGDQLRTVQNQFTKEVTSVSFIGDGETVVASSGDSKVRIVNSSSGGNVRDYPGSVDFVYSAAASADGKFVVAGGADGVLRVWTENGTAYVTFEAPKVEAAQTAAK